MGSPLLGNEYDPVTTDPKGEALIPVPMSAYSLVDGGKFSISATRGLLAELHSCSEALHLDHRSIFRFVAGEIQQGTPNKMKA